MHRYCGPPARTGTPYGHELADERYLGALAHRFLDTPGTIRTFRTSFMLAESELYGNAFDVAARAASTLHCDALARHLAAPTRG